MGLYKRKPDTIEAFQYLIAKETPKWFAQAIDDGLVTPGRGTAEINHPAGGKHDAVKGDYILLLPTGEIQALKPDVFKSLYEAADLQDGAKDEA